MLPYVPQEVALKDFFVFLYKIIFQSNKVAHVLKIGCVVRSLCHS